MKKFESRFVDGKIAWQIKHFSFLQDDSGNLGVIEVKKQFGFSANRVFFIKDLDKHSIRGHHSHKELQQVIVCLSGSFSIKLDNGHEVETIKLQANDNCLYLDGKVWREMSSFEDGTILLVICDLEYELDEVIRDYDQFKSISG